MKLIIAGGRDYNDYRDLKFRMDFMREHQLEQPITEIVSGGAKGADALGEQYAKEYNIPLKIFPADWDKHGKAAGPIRNRQMAEYADILVAVWDGNSRGTSNMMDVMRQQKKPVFVIPYGQLLNVKAHDVS